MIPRVDRPVFVVGPPRSGTTMLWVMLNRHPALQLLGETHLLDVWLPREPALADGDQPAFERFWPAFTASPGFGYLGLPEDEILARLHAAGRRDAAAVLSTLMTLACERAGVRRGGEKTPDHARYLDELFAWYPDARVVFLVRDPRATVASELRLDAHWASHDPEVAAERWRRCADAWLRWHTDPRVTTVRYETLVTEPTETLVGVCAHIEVPYDERVLAPDRAAPGGYRHGDRDPWGGMQAAAIEAWRGTLDAAAIAVIEQRCGALARRMGYPAPAAGAGWAVRLAIARRRLAIARRRIGGVTRRTSPRARGRARSG